MSVNIATISTSADSEVWNLVSRYSSLSKLVRISIYILRFVKRTLRHVSFSARISPVIRDFLLHDHFTISGDQVRHAKILWCYLTQRTHFKREFEFLKAGRGLSKGHALQNLFPIYRHGFIRVGGRLKLSKVSNYSPICQCVHQFRYQILSSFDTAWRFATLSRPNQTPLLDCQG